MDKNKKIVSIKGVFYLIDLQLLIFDYIIIRYGNFKKYKKQLEHMSNEMFLFYNDNEY